MNTPTLVLNKVCNDALTYESKGLSVIPIRTDGSKAPTIPWKGYQSKRLSPKEIIKIFHGNIGIAIIAGKVSGNLEILDFDKPGLFEKWSEIINDLAPSLLLRLPQISTPSRGAHVYYCCPIIENNQKLAEELVYVDTGNSTREVLIETRGEGGYALSPPSPGACHPSGKKYEHFAGPPLTEIPTITPEERKILFDVARSFNKIPVHTETQELENTKQTNEGRLRPGDDFNSRASWDAILPPHEWKHVKQMGETTYWSRPGKMGPGISATTNYCGNLFYNFSSNAYPFQPNTAYNKFAAYTLLEHGGDYRSAALALAREGYGDQSKLNDNEVITSPSLNNSDGVTHIKPWRSSDDSSWENCPETKWLIKDFMPVGSLVLMAGREGSMKTWKSLNFACHLATADFKVLYVDAEGPIGMLQKRYKALNPSKPIYIWSWYDEIPPPENFNHALWTEVSKNYDLVIIDTLKRFMGKSDENDSSAMSQITQGLRKLTKGKASFFLLHHRSKNNDGGGYRGSTELGAGVDIVLILKKIKTASETTLEINAEKHRWLPDPQWVFKVTQENDAPVIEDITKITENRKNETIEDLFKKIQNTIAEELAKGAEVTQSHLSTTLISKGILKNRTQTQKILNEGENKYWTTSTEGHGHPIFYRNLLSCPTPSIEKVGQAPTNKGGQSEHQS